MDKPLFFIIAAAITLVILALTYAIRYIDFKDEFSYLKMEIKRGNQNEAKHYRKKRRRLIIAFLFFL